MAKSAIQEEALRDEWCQATHAQEGIWFTERLGGVASAYHLPLALWFDGRLDVPSLVNACEAAVRRHNVLASAIQEHDGVPYLVAAPAVPKVARVDLSAVPEVHRDDQLSRLIRAETLRRFDPERGPL